jgi:hypothetical protein
MEQFVNLSFDWTGRSSDQITFPRLLRVRDCTLIVLYDPVVPTVNNCKHRIPKNKYRFGHDKTKSDSSRKQQYIGRLGKFDRRENWKNRIGKSSWK